MFYSFWHACQWLTRHIPWSKLHWCHTRPWNIPCSRSLPRTHTTRQRPVHHCTPQQLCCLWVQTPIQTFVSLNLHVIATEVNITAMFSIAPNADTLGLPYDFDSVMHFSVQAFSRRGRFLSDATIRPKDSNIRTFRLGQRYGFTALDLAHINIRYCSGMYNYTCKQYMCIWSLF